MKAFGKTSIVVGMLVATAALAASPAGAQLVYADSGSDASAGTTASVQGQVGLAGDSPLSRVSAPDPEGLTGDSALTRAREPIAATPAQDSGERWRWLGIGSGAGAVLLAAALSLAVGQRRRVALP